MEENYLYMAVLGVLTIAFFIGILRFIKGPTASDRVVALDTLSIIATAGLVFLGYIFKRYIYLDVALIYGVLGFIGVIIIARYLEKAL